MQVAVHEGRSRAFNVFLRFFHLGLSLLVAQLIWKISNIDCSRQFTAIGFPISLILLLLNLIFIIITRCKN